jgi:hypothetical protein
MVFEFFHVFHVESDSINLISICKPRYGSIFFYLLNHQFIDLVILQISKNIDLSMSINEKKFGGPAISNTEKNIECPPLLFSRSEAWVGK